MDDSTDVSELLQFDRQHLYHPYTSFARPLPVYPLARAEGVTLELMDGRKLVDGMSSWWAAVHGYNHPDLNAALTAQMHEVAHVMFGGLTHAPAVNLARELLALAPDGLQQVFFCDSGSVAVEVAMKMALQYWIAHDMPQRHRFLALRGGYHGDTFDAMSVCDPVTGMHHLFGKVLPRQIFAPRPSCRFSDEFDESVMADVELLLSAHGQELAAVIVEPIVQGAGGMHFYHPEYLRRLRALCAAHDVLLITDEIATGFGRTGAMFGCEHAKISPDIMCVGKALTGGYMTLAAALCTDAVTQTIAAGPGGGTFMHGPTYMANPLACAVGLASLELLRMPGAFERVSAIEEQLCHELSPCGASSAVAEVRVLGAIGVVEMRQEVDVAEAQRFFVERGAWIRPFGKLIYLMPPFVITPQELSVLTAAVCAYVS